MKSLGCDLYLGVSLILLSGSKFEFECSIELIVVSLDLGLPEPCASSGLVRRGVEVKGLGVVVYLFERVFIYLRK